MSRWYEVFDNEEVQYRSRKHAARWLALTMTLAGVTAFLLLLSRHGDLSPWLAGTLITSSWSVLTVVALRHLVHLRRLVWCVKLSEQHLVGYDYTRRKTVFAWEDVRSLSLTREGLLLTSTADQSIMIPSLFPDYALLSHRVVHYAEHHGIPILIDGKPWHELDVYALYPFLEAGSAGPAPS